ncbi:hypothetical protein BpHYR1_027441 [Brachionus plicatilis]|uniref:Uncharacterized protein n=1 Tax=Brachionus plicatilis TaxID=10195 RepID=A0A3M7SRM7_BRAPC|nr:hypothetical protein BpHYR1_027441 [Brachionus plicatilis]
MGLVPMICDKVDSFDCHVVRSGTCNFHMLDGHKPRCFVYLTLQVVVGALVVVAVALLVVVAVALLVVVAAVLFVLPVVLAVVVLVGVESQVRYESYPLRQAVSPLKGLRVRFVTHDVLRWGSD